MAVSARVLCALFSILGFTNVVTSQVPNCSVPEHSIVWNNSLTGKTVTVEWAYGEPTCSDIQHCYDADWLPAQKLEPQLRPVEIQKGEHIRFHPIKNSGIRFPIRPVKVNEDQFISCSTDDSVPVITTESEEEFPLDDKFLDSGINYFIADLTDDRLIRCIFGLRLKIVVKENNCTIAQAAPVCSNNGNCVSQKLGGNYQCSCCHGFKGDFCEIVDYCADLPCQNNGTCQLYYGQKTDAGFQCKCPQGYVGDRCETFITSQCDLDPCHNNASCQGNLHHYRCDCQPGFTGRHCEVNINECESIPCANSGICVDKDNAFQCFCLPGFGGEQCEMQYNECDSNPCLNEGVCLDKVDKFKCDCHMGYNGSLCETKLSLCADNPCQNHSHSACEDTGLNYTCTCLPGYTGFQCEVNINECQTNPCQNGGICKDNVNGYSCQCKDLYFGETCEKMDEFLGPSRHLHPTFEEEPRSMHVHNLFIVGGTLGGALVLALIILIVCYCRTHRTYETLARRTGYERQKDDFKFATHDVSSVCRPRPSIDSIWEATTLNYHSDQLNTSVKQSLKPKRV